MGSPHHWSYVSFLCNGSYLVGGFGIFWDVKIIITFYFSYVVKNGILISCNEIVIEWLINVLYKSLTIVAPIKYVVDVKIDNDSENVFIDVEI
jgi:hypothetical protein